jgi:hypothetical protein
VDTKNGARTEKIWLKQGSGAFLRRNWASRGLSARIQGLKHNYTYKPKVYSVKDQEWTSDGKN